MVVGGVGEVVSGVDEVVGGVGGVVGGVVEGKQTPSAKPDFPT